MTDNIRTDVVIVGAGIGGLTTALALHAKGIKSIILEAANRVDPLGLGLNVQPAAIAELTKLGFAELLAATGIPTRAVHYLNHHGEVVWIEPRGIESGHKYPQYSIHRGALQIMLLAAVRDRIGSDAVRTGTVVERFEQRDRRVLAHGTYRPDGSAVTVTALALVGADGFRSVIRSQLFPDDCRPLPAGVQMWRGVTEVEDFLDGRTMIIANDDRATRLVAYPISARHADHGLALLNWVCLVPGDQNQPPEESGWNRSGSLDEVLPHYLHWDFGWLDIPDLLTHGSGLLKYPMMDRDPLPVWGSGRVTLLGDAAHPMYPIGANGASQAIIDGCVLAAALAGEDDTVGALRHYEDVRRRATTAIVLANREMDLAERGAATRNTGGESAELAGITASYSSVVDRANAIHGGERF